MRSSGLPGFFWLGLTALLMALVAAPAQAASAYVRVSEVGYETAQAPFRAYLMSTTSEEGATFKVINSNRVVVYSGAIGALLGVWSHSEDLTYSVYALDFSVAGGDIYTISVTGPAPAGSPKFAVAAPDALYGGLLLNTLWFYQTQRDGPDYIQNALRDRRDISTTRRPPFSKPLR